MSSNRLRAKSNNIRELTKTEGREKNWDQRFFLYKIPPYDAFKDVNYLSLGLMKSKIKYEQFLEKEKQKKLRGKTPRYTEHFIIDSLSGNKSAKDKKKKFFFSATFNKGINENNKNDFANTYNFKFIGKKKMVEEKELTEEELYLIDEFEIIKEMWNKLGVTKGYQENFINFINSLDNIDNMKVYLNMEHKQMQKFKYELTQLLKKIIHRNDQVSNLKQLIGIYKNILKEKKSHPEKKNENLDSLSNLNEKQIIDDIHSCLLSIRINTINVVNQIKSFMMTNSYFLYMNKINLDKIKNDYYYNDEYLLSIRTDLDFIQHSVLTNLYEFENFDGGDPFFLSFSKMKEEGNDNNEEEHKNKKRKLDINRKILEEIQNCIFFMQQAEILLKSKNVNRTNPNKNRVLGFLNSGNNNKEENSKKKSYGIGNLFKGNLEQDIIKLKMTKKYDNIFNFIKTNNQNQNLVNRLKISGKKKHKIPLMTSQELKKKFTQYELLNELMNEQNKENKKENEFKKRDQEININNMQNQEEKKEDLEQNNKELEENKANDENIENNKEVNDKKDNEDVKEEDKQEQDKQEEKSEEKVEEEHEQKEEKIDNKTEETPELKEGKVEDNIEETPGEKEEKKIEDKNEEKEETKVEDKIEETSEQNEENKVEEKKEEEENEKKEDEKIETNEEKIEQKHSESKIEEEIDEVVQQIQNENKEEKIIPTYSATFFVESLDKLSFLYNNYLSSDPTIYTPNTQNKSREFITGIYPKIIIAKKDKVNEDKIYGICGINFYLDENKEYILKINHISVCENNKDILDKIIELVEKEIKYKICEIELLKNNNIREENNILKEILESKEYKEYLDNEDIIIMRKQNICEDTKITNEIGSQINYDSLAVLSLIKKEENDVKNRKYNCFNKVINPIILSMLIDKLKINDKYQVELIPTNSSKTALIEKLSKLENKVFDFITSQNNDCNSINDVTNNEIMPSQGFSYSMINNSLNIKMSTIMTLNIDNYLYNGIDINIKNNIIKEQKFNNNLYVLPTISNNIFIIIYQYNEEFETCLNRDNNNIFNQFTSLFNITIKNYISESHNDNDTNNQKVLWIPTFNINTNLFSSGLDINNQINIKNNENCEMTIDEYNEFLKISYLPDSNKDKNIEMNINNNDKDIIIKDKFLFGICHKEFLESCDVPIISLINVTKDNFMNFK